MQTIGERLEEGRKKKGISVREASEATKIRSDFLNFFESNRFSEVPLPEIYKRGFLRIYSSYLKIDPEPILADYTALQLGSARANNRSQGREFLGRMDLPASESRKSAGENRPAASDTPHEPVFRPEVARESPSPFDQGESAEPDYAYSRPSRGGNPADSGIDKALYWKVGLAGVSALVLFLLVYSLIKAITSPSGDPDALVADRPTARAESERSSSAPAASDETKQIVLVGLGEVFVQVKQLRDGEFLFRGTLASGQRVPLQVRGSADIAFTQGSNLQIVKNGRVFEPDTSRSQVGKINTDNL